MAALSDDIAYNNHDIDDGIRSGILEVEPLRAIPLIGGIFDRVEKRWPGIDRTVRTHEVVRELIGIMVGDVLEETRRRLDAHKPRSAEELRALSEPMVAFSEDMMETLAELRRHLFAHMYTHYKVNRMMSQAGRVTRDLFDLYLSDPGVLPTDVQMKFEGQGEEAAARVICDHIAGMTDRFAMEEHRRLFTVQGYF